MEKNNIYGNYYIPDSNFSKKCWIPVDKNLKSPKNIIENAWFNSEYKERLNTNNKQIVNFELTKNKSIEIFFTEKQSKIMKTWFCYYRYIYNLTVTHLKADNPENKNFVFIYNKIKNSINNVMKKQIETSKMPTHMIYSAINEAYKVSLNINLQLRYKNEKSIMETILLKSSCFSTTKEYNKLRCLFNKIDKEYEPIISIFELINIDDILKMNKNSFKNSFCTSIMGDYIKTSKSIKGIHSDCRLSYNKKLNTFYLYVLKKNKTNIVDKKKGICVLDPGVRCFQTGYTLNGVLEIGNNVSLEVGKLVTKMEKYNKNNDIKNREKCCKTNKILVNKINELHHKTCNYLCSQYKCIVIGKLSTENVDESIKQNYVLQLLSHNTFRERLKLKCKEYNVKYLEVDESYTSKVCSNCGFYKKNLGCNKRYNCNYCNIDIDRDYNACRNILIKNHNIIDMVY